MNWAYQSSNNNKEDTSGHFHIFVGDLSNEVNDEVLFQAFSTFGTISEARVMWDMKTGRSRGYGFVAYRDRSDAEKALSSMDGEWLGSRAIRCNWANQKGQPSISQQNAMAAMGLSPATPFGHHQYPVNGVQSYEMILSQTPSWQTTCYVGNLTPYTTQNDLVPLFQNFGYVTETRLSSDRGFAFVKMDTHENAAMAICQLSGYQVNGRPLKCSVRTIDFCLTRTLTKNFCSGARTVLRLANSIHSRQLLSNQALQASDSLHQLHLPTRSTVVVRCPRNKGLPSPWLAMVALIKVLLQDRVALVDEGSAHNHLREDTRTRGSLHKDTDRCQETLEATDRIRDSQVDGISRAPLATAEAARPVALPTMGAIRW